MLSNKLSLSQYLEEFSLEEAEDNYEAYWKQILSLPKKSSGKWGTIEGINIELVDGDKVKNDNSMDFVEGGHDLVYDFIPEKTIWLDDELEQHDYKFILFHEFIERKLMSEKNYSYDKAHNIANKHEHEKREKYINEEATKEAKAYVFDFDETLVHDKNHKYDHINNPKKYKMWNKFKKLDKEISSNSNDVLYILTARRHSIVNEMYDFFIKNKIKNLKKENIFAMGSWDKNKTKQENKDQIAENKAKILEKLKTKHNGNIVFYDDTIENIEAAKDIDVESHLVKEEIANKLGVMPKQYLVIEDSEEMDEELDFIDATDAYAMVIGPDGIRSGRAFVYDKFDSGELLTESAITGHSQIVIKLEAKTKHKKIEENLIRGYWIPAKSTLMLNQYYRAGKHLIEPSEEIAEEVINLMKITPKIIEIIGKKGISIKEEDESQNIKDQKRKIINEFIRYVVKELEIKTKPRIILQKQREALQTTGVYKNKEHEIRVNTKNRALVDILRTIGHELVHHMQDEQGKLKDDHQNIGGPIEDEANAKAGAFLKKFAKETGNDIYSDELNISESVELKEDSLSGYEYELPEDKENIIQENLDYPKKNWKSWKNDDDWSDKEKASIGKKEVDKIVSRWYKIAKGKIKDPNFTDENKEPLKQLNKKMKLEEYIQTLENLDEAIVSKYEFTGDGKLFGKLKKQKKSNVIGRRVERGSNGALSERRMTLSERLRRSRKAAAGNFKAKAKGKHILGKHKKITNAKINPFAK